MCDSCTKSSLGPAASRCYRCLEDSLDGVTCNRCAQNSPIRSVRAVTPYRGTAKLLVHSLKFARAKAAATVIGDILAKRFPSPLLDYIVIPIPTATSRVRLRGYDQSVLIARACAHNLRLPFYTALARLGHTRQVGANRTARRTQLRQAFMVRAPRAVRGKRVILIDDVMTTGASIEAAARALVQAGAASIDVYVFAVA